MIKTFHVVETEKTNEDKDKVVGDDTVVDDDGSDLSERNRCNDDNNEKENNEENEDRGEPEKDKSDESNVDNEDLQEQNEINIENNEPDCHADLEIGSTNDENELLETLVYDILKDKQNEHERNMNELMGFMMNQTEENKKLKTQLNQLHRDHKELKRMYESLKNEIEIVRSNNKKGDKPENNRGANKKRKVAERKTVKKKTRVEKNSSKSSGRYVAVNGKYQGKEVWGEYIREYHNSLENETEGSSWGFVCYFHDNRKDSGSDQRIYEHRSVERIYKDYVRAYKSNDEERKKKWCKQSK